MQGESRLKEEFIKIKYNPSWGVFQSFWIQTQVCIGVRET